MGRNSGAYLSHLGQIFSRGTASGLSERELLDRFLAENDEVAFAALLGQHGPMVLGVCRRLLDDPHEIEDAFQATFLVFVRRAGTIRGGESVGRWLHGVARRVAVRARVNAVRRNVREQKTSGMEPISAQGSAQAVAVDRELSAILDEELMRLPATLSAPMVLCYLEGLTHDEAAGRLGWPVGTVRSRLARARDTLRHRLSRRGLTADDATWTAAIAYRPVSSTLLDSTVRLSLAFTARHSTATALASATSAVLAKGVLHAMMISKLKILGSGTMACALALGGLQTYAVQFGGAGGAQKPDAPGPQAIAEDLRQDPERSVAKLQADLAEAKVNNEILQKHVNDLRKELDSLRQPAKPGGQTRQTGPVSASTSTTGTAAAKAAAGVPGVGKMGMGGMGGAGGTTSVTPAFIVNPVRDHVYGPKVATVGTAGGGMMGGSKDRLNYIQTSRLIIVPSPEGDTVTGYSTETGKARSLRLTKANERKLEVIPIVTPGLAALQLKGSKITRIAAFSGNDGTWYPQELREPVDKAVPWLGPGMVAYGIGRRVYAFSPVAARWDVLELPEGVVAQPAIGSDTIICEHKGHLYVFSVKTGTWEDIDTRAVPDDPADAKK